MKKEQSSNPKSLIQNAENYIILGNVKMMSIFSVSYLNSWMPILQNPHEYLNLFGNYNTNKPGGKRFLNSYFKRLKDPTHKEPKVL